MVRRNSIGNWKFYVPQAVCTLNFNFASWQMAQKDIFSQNIQFNNYYYVVSYFLQVLFLLGH